MLMMLAYSIRWPHTLPGMPADWMRPERAGSGAALTIPGRTMRQPAAVIDSPQRIREFPSRHLAGWDPEGFAVLFLDTQRRMNELEVIFEGTPPR